MRALHSTPRRSRELFDPSNVERPTDDVDVCIVGAGPAGLSAAIRLKQLEQEKGREIRVVVLEKNVGKGGAVRHGMLHARGRRLLMVDADGASRFEDLELLWSAMDEISPKGEAAVVVGSRAHLVKTEAVVKVRSLSNLARSPLSLEGLGCSGPCAHWTR